MIRGITWKALLAVSAVLLAEPAVADRFTLADALAMAYEHNPELAAARAKTRAADDAVAEARGNYRPTINVTGSYGYTRVDELGLYNQRKTTSSATELTPTLGRATLVQPVYTGGQAYAQTQRAIALVRAARADLLNAEQQILFAATQAYMDTVRDADGLRLHRSDVDVLTRQRDATKTQLDAGAATRTDLDETDVRLAGAKAELAQAESQLAQSRDNFERIIGRAPETLEQAPSLPRLPGTQEQALAFALKLSPRIQGAQANDKAAQYGIDNAVGATLPHGSIVADYNYGSDALTNPFSFKTKAGIFDVLGQLNIPLYQGGAEDARIREAKEQRAQTRFGVVDADQATRQIVKDSWATFHTALNAVAYNQGRVAASERALDGVIQQQHQGERSILDILNAEQERLSAELALSASRHDMVVGAYQLLAAEGRLTAGTLGLKVKLYDPNTHYKEHSASWIDFGSEDDQ
ncbi:MAG: TolC family outer membrane protein [Alphaproteobacteria bacterium]|nr:TolC family outer membrane protein [Alphaproteobacteria bacterium]